MGGSTPDGWTMQPLLTEIQWTTLAGVAASGTTDSAASCVVLDEFVGTITDGLRNLRITVGYGVGGQALGLGRPVSVRDYPRAQGITHHYDTPVQTEGLRAMFAVPVRVHNGPSGLVYGAYRRPGPVGDGAIDLTVAAVRRFEYEWTVRIETERRLRELGGDLRAVGPARYGPASADQQVCDIYAELVHIASTAPNDTMRDRIEDLLHRIECRSDHTGNAQGVAPVRLSRREIDVLTQVAVGCSNHEVAARLELVPSTVKSYLQSAYRKLDVSNRTEAVAVARRSGLIP